MQIGAGSTCFLDSAAEGDVVSLFLKVFIVYVADLEVADWEVSAFEKSHEVKNVFWTHRGQEFDLLQ